MSRPVRILHVVEALGGGVEAAIQSYVETTREFEHGLVFRWRTDDRIGSDLLARVDYAREVTTGARGFLATLRAAMGEWDPQVIHAHSSRAGLYARLLPQGSAGIAYTPHGFALERRDVGRASRLAFRFAENLLALRPHAVGAVGPREADLARALWRGSTRHVVVVPNVGRATPVEGAAASTTRRARGGAGRRIVGVGRVSAAKGTDFFRAAALATGAVDPTLQWRWIGGGDPVEEARMRDAGIEVTGWCSREVTLAELAAADLYVHTASWEGCPVSLLEAVELGVPTIVRDIPALASLGCRPVAGSPAELARLVLHVDDDDVQQQLRDGAARLRAAHTTERQGAGLRELYRPFVEDIR